MSQNSSNLEQKGIPPSSWA